MNHAERKAFDRELRHHPHIAAYIDGTEVKLITVGLTPQQILDMLNSCAFTVIAGMQDLEQQSPVLTPSVRDIATFGKTRLN